MEEKQIVEREIIKTNGAMALLLLLLGLLGSIGLFVASIFMMIEGDTTGKGIWYAFGGISMGVSIIAFVFILIFFAGLHAIKPNEALVLTLFGKYYGTIKKSGFYFTNPFCSAVTPSSDSAAETVLSIQSSNNGAQVNASLPKGNKISTKVMTLNNQKQKVNDVLGNPIVIGAVVIWKVVDPTKAVLNIDNYYTYLSTQCDSTIRNIARLYPYDLIDEDEDDGIKSEKSEKTLRGSSVEIADSMKDELQKKVEEAGIRIMEVKITHLSYAEEIAAAMLQRQQATAIIAARQKIVEGAVSMVKMAIDQLNEDEIVVLDEERKAAMVSNLMVVLCGNKEAQPIVNSGSIY